MNRLAATLLAILLACGVAAGVTPRVAVAEDSPPPPAVKLVIDYGDGVQKHFTALPWKAGMTVLDALQAAGRHPRGIKIAFRGKGATAFVTQIDDVENEGRGQNWVFRVNGELARQSCGALEVKAADTILWTFGEYR